MSIEEAFFSVCDNAKPAKSCYVSLYAQIPYYGGPEEGGWWGNDCKLIAYKCYSTQEAADAAKTKVEELAKRLSEESKRKFGETCQSQLEWCEAHNIDDSNSVFGEVDGETKYFVVQEDTPGKSESIGPRHYE